jgi:hypothetical protein
LKALKARHPKVKVPTALYRAFISLTALEFRLISPKSTPKSKIKDYS